MAIEDTKKIAITHDAQRANEFIKLGWTLLALNTGKDESGFPLATYHLGWQGQGDPIQPPF